jgi:hypothetical protein
MLCLWTLASTSLAAPRWMRAPPRQAPARAQPLAEQASAPGAGAPSLVSLRLQLGVGGGDGSMAARVGAQLDLWQTDPLGIGVLGAAAAHVQADMEGSRSLTLIGPVLSLRGEPSDGYFRGALALGLATWSCRPAACAEGEHGRSVFGAELMVGYAAHAAAFGFGWHAGLVVLPPPVRDAGVSYSLTLNLDLGAEL